MTPVGFNSPNNLKDYWIARANAAPWSQDFKESLVVVGGAMNNLVLSILLYRKVPFLICSSP